MANTMEVRNYYQILELDRNSTQEDIRQAYRRLAMLYHPDHRPADRSAEEKFKGITEAFKILGDPIKRARYDRSTAVNLKSAKPQDARVSQASKAYHSNKPPETIQSRFSNLINKILGKGSNGQQDKSGKNSGNNRYEHPIRISLEQAFRGTERTIQIEGKSIKVKIPTGARTGTRVRIAGIGPSGLNGKRTDIYLAVHVDSNNIFERKENDLFINSEIDLFTAVLGGQVTIPHFEGSTILTIPPGTQPGQLFRLAGKGMPVLQNSFEKGNLMVRVKIQIPRNLTAQQLELFDRLRQISLET